MLRSACVLAVALVAAKPLPPNQNPELAAWEDELIKARVDAMKDPAANSTYNRAKHPEEKCSRARAEGAGIVGYCAHTHILAVQPLGTSMCLRDSASCELLPTLSSPPMCRLVELDGGRCGTR